jgi:hypothetical protein
MNKWIKKYISEYTDTIKTESKRLRPINMPEITDKLYDIYEKNGDRMQFEKVYFERRYFLLIFGLASFIFKKSNDLRKLEQIINEICLERCWALPAHVDKTSVGWEHTVELYASETAQALTEICDLLKDRLSKKTIQMIHENVDQRVLLPFYQSDVPYAWWENSEMNWCAVCAGSIGMITISRYKDEPLKLEPKLHRINQALQHYVNGFSKDGACMEGLDYWTYGLSYYAMYEEYLHNYLSSHPSQTSHTINPMTEPYMKPILEFQQKCYFNRLQTLSFSDGSAHSKYRLGLTLYCAAVDPEVIIPDKSCVLHIKDDPTYHWAENFRDYIWTIKYAESVKEEAFTMANQACNYLPDAQWVLCKCSERAFAAKGGNNDEPHNHNDVGSFFIACNGIQFFADLGAGLYVKDYFNQNRYSIFCNNSESHNIPIINHQLQRCGKDAACKDFTYQNDSEQFKLSMDLTDTYERGSLSQFIRQIEAKNDLTQLTITDTFTFNNKTESIEENLVTGLQVKLKENGFTLIDSAGNECLVSLQSAYNIRVLPKEHINHEGLVENIYMVRWELPILQDKEVKSQIHIEINKANNEVFL